jgi:hypothetical protein
MTSGATKTKEKREAMSGCFSISVGDFTLLTPIGCSRDGFGISGLDFKIQGHAKIGEFDISCFCSEDVCSLEIAMDHLQDRQGGQTNISSYCCTYIIAVKIVQSIQNLDTKRTYQLFRESTKGLQGRHQRSIFCIPNNNEGIDRVSLYDFLFTALFCHAYSRMILM